MRRRLSFRMSRAVPRESRHYGRHLQPDYGRCVRIVTGAALKEMVLPGILAVAMPLCVGLIFRHFGAEFNPSEATDVPMISGVAINLSGAEAVAGC